MSSEFFVHRVFCPQINTDYLFWHGNPRLFKDTAWLRIVVYPRHFVITACLRKFTATLYISSF